MTPTAPRVVLLGASNLTRGLSTVIGHVTARFDGPVEVLAAAGHGRSYGGRSRVLMRALPGIDECGLWAALRPAAGPTYALVTDIGNDIAYGHLPDTIEGWIDRCLGRIARHHARTIMTRLPVTSLRALRPWQFRIVSRLLFPGHSLSFRTAIDRAIELDDRIRALGSRRGVTTLEMDARWYGLDPVHLRRGCWTEAWGRILAPWADEPPGPPPRRSWRRWARLRRATPERWWLLGRARGRRQPAARLADGTTVAFY